LTTRCESRASGGPETLGGWPVRHRLLGVLLALLSHLAIAVVPTAAKLAFEAGANTLAATVFQNENDRFRRPSTTSRPLWPKLR
jgi:hypothetical protein